MIADMRDKITIQSQTVSIDEIGNHINSWFDYYTCWASVAVYRSGKTQETDEAAQTIQLKKLDFTVRRCPQTAQLTSTEYRIIFNGKIFNIDRIDDTSRKTVKISASLVQSWR